MSCPNCGNEDITLERQTNDGQGYQEHEEYSCSKCGCEWEWDMNKTITKQGKQEEECD